MEEKLDNISSDVKDLSKDLKEHVAWEERKYIALENKYATKEMLKWAAGSILAVVTIIISIAAILVK